MPRNLWTALVGATALAAMIAPLHAEEKVVEKRLVGEWTGRLVVAEAAYNKTVLGGLGDEETIRAAVTALQAELDKNTLKLSFQEDGTFCMESAGPSVADKDKKRTGKWSILKSEKTKIKIKIKHDDDKKADEEVTLLFSGRSVFAYEVDGFIIPQFEKK